MSPSAIQALLIFFNWLTTDILQILHFQCHFFQKLTLNRQRNNKFESTFSFLGQILDITTNLFRNRNSNTLVLIFYHNFLDFPVTHFTKLTFDNHSIDKCLELPLSVRSYAQRTPQLPSTDTAPDVSSRTVSSSSNVLVNTHHIGNTAPSFNPPPMPSSQPSITTQPSTYYSSQQHNTPYNTPSPTHPVTTQPSISDIHQTFPSIPLSFHNNITTQTQSHSYQTYFPPSLSSFYSNTQSSFSASQIFRHPKSATFNFKSSSYIL